MTHDQISGLWTAVYAGLILCIPLAFQALYKWLSGLKEEVKKTSDRVTNLENGFASSHIDQRITELGIKTKNLPADTPHNPGEAPVVSAPLPPPDQR